MDLHYELVEYSDTVRDAYLKLLPEQEQLIAGGKLEWKFRLNPAGTGRIAIARNGGETVGVNAFMAVSVQVSGSAVRGYQSMDTIVSPAARGKGVFGKLIACFYRETDGDVLYGFPNLNSSPGFFGKLGWTHFGAVPMLVRPLRMRGMLRRFGRFLPNLPLPVPGGRLAGTRTIERFDASTDAVWDRFAKDIGCAVRRDSAFLNWRLCDHPSETYQIRQAPDGSFVASIVVDKHGGRIGYLMEAVGEPRTLRKLIAGALREMRAQGAELAFAWCFGWSPNRSAYSRNGFLPFPVRLRPIVINAGARATGSDDPRLTTARQWYVSYLDSDTV